jgi:carbon monoxide dehydrogenase subunit G
VKLEQQFEVDAPLDVVWAALIDVQRVAPCLPGAEVTDLDEDGTYNGTFSVKLGPTTASYRGKLKIEEVDEAAHRATMRASGTDKRGQGGAKALMVSTVKPSDAGGTLVDVATDFTITGRLASFSRGGMIKDISNRLLREFAQCLQETLKSEQAGQAAQAAPAASEEAAAAASAGLTVAAAGAAPEAAAAAAASTAAASRPTTTTTPRPAAKPISGFSVFFGALWDRVKRLFSRAS